MKTKMRGMAATAVLILLCALCRTPVFAAVKTSVTLDKKSITLGGTFTLSITHPSSCKLAPPGSKKMAVVSSESAPREERRKTGKLKSVSSVYSGQSLQRFNSAGSAPAWRRRTKYTIRPAAVGTLAVGPLKVTCPENSGWTKKLEIVVLPPPKSASSSKSKSSDILYKTISLQSTSSTPQRRRAALQPPSEPLISREPATPVTNPVRIKKAAPEGPPPESAAAEDFDRMARYAKGFAGAGAKSFAQYAKIVALAVGIILGAWAGFVAVRKTRYYEQARLAALKLFGQKEKEDGLIGGKYEVLTELGEGGMGTVLLANDVKLNRKVALKKLHSDQRFDLKHREKLVEEARIVSQLNHPYIVSIHEIIEHQNNIYLVLDYVEGKPLSHIISERKHIPLKECVEWMTHVCQAIDFAHKKGMLHLDLKPSNIMVDRNGYAKVMDFGLACKGPADGEAVTKSGAHGTLWYMPPEQHLGTSNPSSDVYALGVCLYEMLTGELPFKGENYMAEKEGMHFQWVSQLAPDVNPAVDQILSEALAPDPMRRLQTPLKFLERLKTLS